MAGAASPGDRPRSGAVLSRVDAIILAGGLGQRMHPLTLDRPKPLLPVGPRSLAEHQVRSVVAAGAERVVLATGYRREDFAELVTSIRSRGIELRTVEEARPLGTGGGLRGALRALPDAEEVIVLNGDLLTGHDLRRQVALLQQRSSEILACVHVREVPDPHRYGSVVLGLDEMVTAFVEKSPAPPSRSINAGTYVVRPGLLDRMPTDGVVSLERDVFPGLARARQVMAHREDAYFRDVGSPEALLEANRDHVLGRLPGAPGPSERLLLPGAVVDPTARVGGGTLVHPGAVIGPGARVDGCLLLPDAHVDAGALVERSVLGRGTRVGRRARVRRSALGTGQQVAPGERVDEAHLPRRDA